MATTDTFEYIQVVGTKVEVETDMTTYLNDSDYALVGGLTIVKAEMRNQKPINVVYSQTVKKTIAA